MKRKWATCRWAGCGRSDRMKNGFCDRHYQQSRRPQGAERGRHFDVNELLCHEGYGELICTGRDGQPKGRILVSPGDLSTVLPYRWHVCASGYGATTVTSGGREHLMMMHRLLLGLSDVAGLSRIEEVDHANRDKLDNRRENLRVVTVSQNHWNRDPIKPDGLRWGVTHRTANGYEHKPWCAAMKYPGEGKQRVRFFATYEEAVQQRVAWETERASAAEAARTAPAPRGT